MEYQIADYINYLLFSHDCVIVPGFGGFILNREEAVYEDKRLTAPKLSITFNQELRHNDGILVTHCQTKENISYDAAYKKIKAAVAKINLDLKQGNRVVMGKVGVFYLNDNQAVSFEPNSAYIHPDYIGLSEVRLNPLAFMLEEDTPLRKRSRWSYIAAAAVVALFFISPSLHIGEQNVSVGQQADFSHLLMTTSPANTVKDAEVPSETAAITSTLVENVSVEMPQAQKTSLRTYYIVVASETSKRRTDILLNKIQKDFPNAVMLKSSERYRLYAASFDDKDTAEDYLQTFRKEYPKYKNAWLLSQRNR